ncbi:MAG: hypothetical protein ABFD57_08640 [Smithella sp.]
MRLFIKLFNVIIVLICLTGNSFADSDGIIFNWEPFIADDYLQLSHPSKKIIPPKILIPKEIFRKTNDAEKMLISDSKAVKDSFSEMTKDSVIDRIKITFSSVNSFMLPYDEIYQKDNGGKIPRAARTLPSLMRSPSQESAVETIKLIEPQINLGIEF